MDSEKFPALDLAYSCVSRGALFGTILNASKEIALDKFIAGEIGFLDITFIVKKVLDSKEIIDFENKSADKLEDIICADSLTRDITRAASLT